MILMMIYEFVLEAEPRLHIKHSFSQRSTSSASTTTTKPVRWMKGEKKTHCIRKLREKSGTQKKGDFRSFYGNDCEICLQLTFDNRQMRIYRILMGLLHGTFYDSYFRRIIFIPSSSFFVCARFLKSRQMWFFSSSPFSESYDIEVSAYTYFPSSAFTFAQEGRMEIKEIFNVRNIENDFLWRWWRSVCGRQENFTSLATIEI